MINACLVLSKRLGRSSRYRQTMHSYSMKYVKENATCSSHVPCLVGLLDSLLLAFRSSCVSSRQHDMLCTATLAYLPARWLVSSGNMQHVTDRCLTFAEYISRCKILYFQMLHVLLKSDSKENPQLFNEQYIKFENLLADKYPYACCFLKLLMAF